MDKNTIDVLFEEPCPLRRGGSVMRDQLGPNERIDQTHTMMRLKESERERKV